MSNRLADEAAYFGAIEDYKASQPRALVAISEDRQWLVTHEANDMPLHFAVWRRAGGHVIGWIFERYVEDTGQDADAVLAAFLARKED